jgi:arylsulfatase A-like enzyme
LPTLGTIYTTSKSKIAEHGGGSDDDRHVACFFSHPKLEKKSISGSVSTTQVAPTVLKALGIDPQKLLGVVLDKTQVLSGW